MGRRPRPRVPAQHAPPRPQAEADPALRFEDDPWLVELSRRPHLLGAKEVKRILGVSANRVRELIPPRELPGQNSTSRKAARGDRWTPGEIAVWIWKLRRSGADEAAFLSSKDRHESVRSLCHALEEEYADRPLGRQELARVLHVGAGAIDFLPLPPAVEPLVGRRVQIYWEPMVIARWIEGWPYGR
jgi:hypothetical protein